MGVKCVIKMKSIEKHFQYIKKRITRNYEMEK